MERYPANTKITLDDFNACGWREALQGASQKDYFSMYEQLSTEARKVTEEGKLEIGKVLSLLADACSMILKPDSLNESFSPFVIMDGKRSMLPEDFKKEDIEFFSEIASRINEPKLCARISDLLWLLQKPRNPDDARRAIDSYTNIEFSVENWNRDGIKCWDRAIQLCLSINAQEKLQNIESKIVDTLKQSSANECLADWLADLLSKHRLGGQNKKEIAEKLEEYATHFENCGELYKARNCLDIASEWYKNSQQTEQSITMIVRSAESFVKEAIARKASDDPSNIAAAIFYESAIHKYRLVPKAYREKFNVENRIVELKSLMHEAQENLSNEMNTFSSDSIDISELVENAIRAVKGKDLSEVLLQFANIYRITCVDKMRNHSEKMIKNYPLQSWFPTNYMSSDGRVIAKKPAVNLEGEDQDTVVWVGMVEHYIMELNLAVQANIWHALRVIRLEHRLREDDFYSLVRRSPVVPPDRVRLIAKALFQGFDGDFVSAIHLLTPQIENLVRYHLKKYGENTTNIDINGIENENGLSALMKNPKIEEIFGKNLAFELKVIFCDPFGPNLRNEIAHGLVGYNNQNMYFIYAWWFTFRLIFNTFWNANKTSSESDKSASDDAT